MSRFAVAKSSRLTASHVGDEREPLLEADGALEQPNALVELAAATHFAPAFTPAGGYPGLRTPLPDAYIEAIVTALARPIAEAFSLGPIKLARVEGAFSIVTLAANALAEPQRAPHVDSINPWQFAILHYLCDEFFGGTTFYRHRKTAFETLSNSRLPRYESARATEMPVEGYVDDGAPWFEQTARVAAGFNRLIAYRSCMLHSGHIRSPDRLTADPRVGRLTANIFVTFAPRE